MGRVGGLRLDTAKSGMCVDRCSVINDSEDIIVFAPVTFDATMPPHDHTSEPSRAVGLWQSAIVAVSFELFVFDQISCHPREATETGRG